MAYGRFECAAPRRVCPDIRHTTDGSVSSCLETMMPTYVCHDIRKLQNTDRRRHASAKSDSLRIPRHTSRNGWETFRPAWEPKCRLTYATAYRTDMETNTAIQTPPRQPRTRIFADNARGGSPHRTLHVQCKASASLVDRRLPVLAYRFRRSRPYRPALALT